MRCAGRCGSVTRTRCPSCSPCRWTGGSSRTCLGSRARWSGDQEAGAAVAIGGGAGPPPAMPIAPAPAPPPVPPSLDGALATDPDNVPLLVERATRLTAARHYRAAQRDLERALRSDPAHADALAALGVVLSRKGL